MTPMTEAHIQYRVLDPSAVTESQTQVSTDPINA
jgi:hypothetical protein